MYRKWVYRFPGAAILLFWLIEFPVRLVLEVCITLVEETAETRKEWRMLKEELFSR